MNTLDLPNTIGETTLEVVDETTLEVVDEQILHIHIAAPIDDLIQIARWGTRGRGGKQPIHFVKLINCDDEHLEAILLTQPLIGGYKLIIETILQRRKTQTQTQTTNTLPCLKKHPQLPLKLQQLSHES